MNKLKVGIFGAGRGVDLAHSFLALGCDVVALCDFNEKRLEQGVKNLDIKVTTYSNFDDFINHDLDAVVLANYFHEHAPFAIKCFEKNIHVLLPNNYDSSKKYGLIIMIDGQNMYDTSKVGRYTKKNDPYGSWQIETTLNKIANIYHEEYIVCGIETTGIERMFELMPKYFGEFKNDCNLNSNLSKVAESGLLEKTGLFIMNRVIPFVKEKYSISDNIGIGGSSAGGNAAFHIGLNYYDVFKFILSFSPIFGCYEDEYLIDFYNKINFNKNKDNLPYFFFNVGKKGWLERCLWQENCNSLDLMVKCGYPEDKLFGYTEISAEHNEIMWRYAFNYFMNIYHKEKK